MNHLENLAFSLADGFVIGIGAIVVIAIACKAYIWAIEMILLTLQFQKYFFKYAMTQARLDADAAEKDRETLTYEIAQRCRRILNLEDHENGVWPWKPEGIMLVIYYVRRILRIDR